MFPIPPEGSITKARGESTNQSAAFSIRETVLRNDQSEPAEGDRAPTNRLPVKSSDLFQVIHI